MEASRPRRRSRRPSPRMDLAFLSSDVGLNIRLRINNLHGSMAAMAHPGSRPLSYAECLSRQTGCAAADMYLSCQLHAHGQPLGLPERTCNMPGSRLGWNEWITFHAKYCDLSPDAWVALTLVGSEAPRKERILGSARLALFSDARRLRGGVVKVIFHLTGAPSAESVGAKAAAGGAMVGSTRDDEHEIARVEELSARHETATTHPDAALDWLNRPTHAHLETRLQDIGRRLERHFLSVQLPELEFPVLFHEKVVAALPMRLQPSSVPSRRANAEAASGSAAAGLHDAPIVLVSDAEQHRDNPVLHKHHKLARSLLSAGFAKELKPDSEERRRLEKLVQLPPTTRLREEDLELMWKFRYSLTKEKRALTKLLKCVDWADAREVHQAHQLAQQWAVADVQDLLELLGHAFVGAAAWVREFAVAALRDRASDAQLLSYLLPLVQAIQYERVQQQPPAECPLAALLIERSLVNVELANFLHWYLQVERGDVRHGSHYAHVHDTFLQQLQAAAPNLSIALRQQEGLVGALSQAAQLLKASGESRPKRIQRLQAMFEHAEMLGPLKSVTSPLLMLPLDPRLRIVSSLPHRATVFKSALTPLGLTFETAEVLPSAATPSKGPQPYSVIFKSGDDLRQDQLVLQMLMLMDKLLQEQGLDLKLTTYRVLATAPGQGLVERVPESMPLAQLLAENKNDLRRYLQLEHPSPESPYGIDPEVLETFVKSCAGYCVAMYLLGVGDRHLDNLMLRSNGTLFHIDFGYIFGRDPKPFPPPIRLCKEMVEAMGGADSQLYVKFRLLCCEAFNILRRPSASNLILNLLLLMVDADVHDLKGEGDVLKLVTERFRLDLTNEEASRFFQELINSSVSALFPQIVEKIHSWAQAWRA